MHRKQHLLLTELLMNCSNIVLFGFSKNQLILDYMKQEVFLMNQTPQQVRIYHLEKILQTNVDLLYHEFDY